MNTVTFVTSNDLKLRIAQHICADWKITIQREHLDFVEIQADDARSIAADKAAQAFHALQKPLVITDDSWIIPALNGFPGPYMKHVNQWFTIDDWLRLTRDLPDRTIILRQILVYQDANQQKIFTTDIPGILLPKPRGDATVSHLNITSFDEGVSSASEVIATGKSVIGHKFNSWTKLCQWLQETH